MSAGRVVVFGSANVDMVVRVERFPAPGETLLTPGYALHLGGKGANQAVAAARLGAGVAFAGCVGPDDHGEWILAGLQTQGVDTRWLSVGESRSGVAFIQVDSLGQNCIVVAAGANAEVDPAGPAPEALAGADALLLQLELPLAAVLAAARSARAAGVTVVLNLAPAQALGREDLADVDVLVVNELEAATLAGVSRATVLAEPEALARELVALVPQVVVTLGAAGVAYARSATGGGISAGRVAAHDVAVVDTTAAGDAFVGALVAFMVRRPGAELATAVRYANAAAAIATTRAGAQPSLPRAAEVEALLAAPGR